LECLWGLGVNMISSNNRFLNRANKRLRSSYNDKEPETSIVNISSVDYVIHEYKQPGAFLFRPPTGVDAIDVLVVAGGGSGASGGQEYNRSGGGGGAGGMIFEEEYSVSDETYYKVSVGRGGRAETMTNATSTQQQFGIKGEDSVFNDLTAVGGGRGGSGGNPGGDGGSGGGAGRNYFTASSGTTDQGNDGGIGSDAGSGAAAGGGGGAGAVGGDGVLDTSGGAGGNGVSCSITGTAVVYAGGGGGGIQKSSGAGTGGTGGGGNGGANGAGSSGTNNLGAGGGGGGGVQGSSVEEGGDGGHGVVIIKYPLADVTNSQEIYNVGDEDRITINREFVQSNTRLLVDLGIRDNLLSWWDSSSARTNYDGATLKVSQCTDLSDNEVHLYQSNISLQPTLTSLGIQNVYGGFLTPGVNSVIQNLDTKWTIMFWLRLDANDTNQYIFGRWNTGISQRVIGGTYRGGQSEGTKYIQFYKSHDGANTGAVRTDGDFPQETWVHLVWTNDSSGATSVGKLYYDGSEIADVNENITYTNNTDLNSNTVELAVGAIQVSAGASSLIGQWSDFRIFDDVLTSEQITAIYNQISPKFI